MLVPVTTSVSELATSGASKGARSALLAVLGQWQRSQQMPPAPGHRALLSPLCRAGKCPSRVNAKPFFSWSKAARRDSGAAGLCERCSCLLHTKPLIRARRWEGGELLYKQAFKINCFSSLEQELAFQPRDTIKACSDSICLAVYSQGMFGRSRLKFFGRNKSSYQVLCPPGAGNCYSAKWK